MIYKTLIALLAVSSLSGCLHDDDDSNTSPDSLNGTWAQHCNIDEDGDANDSQLVISGAEWVMTGSSYSDIECFEPEFTMAFEAISIEGGETTLADGTLVTEIDHTFTGVFMTPRSASYATAFNTGKFCQIVTWTADKKEDVSSCDSFSSLMGSENYDIYKVENNRLYLGDNDTSGSGDTPEERPTSLDYDDIYQRQ